LALHNDDQLDSPKAIHIYKLYLEARKMFLDYSKIYILCPNAVTGGPEAIHQLHHKIIAMGGSSIIVLYDPSKIF